MEKATTKQRVSAVKPAPSTQGEVVKIKVSSGFSGVIATGQYENSRPSYLAEIEFQIPKSDDNFTDILGLIDTHQKNLQDICYNRFKEDEKKANRERIEAERKDIRWYGDFPSVTSIIGWDDDAFANISINDLKQYASQGKLWHMQAEHFIKTGEWLPVEKIQGTWTDLVILKQGNLKLEATGWDFPAFLKKHPIEKMEIGKVVVSKKYKFGGLPDVRKCIYDGKKTLADFKRTVDKLKGFKQIAAYIIAEEENGESPYEQMMLIPANDKTEQGFSKPVISTEIAQFKKMFLDDRKSFEERFGI